MTKEVNHYTDKSSFGYHTSDHAATSNYVLHCHNYYEIYFFLEGNVDYLVDRQTYHLKPDSMILIQPYVLHGVKVNDDSCYRRLFLHFHPEVLPQEHRDFLLSCFPPYHSDTEHKIYFESTEKYHIKEYFEALRDCAYQPESIQMHTIYICIQALLSQIKLMCLEEAPSNNNPLCTTENATVSRILDYITEHFRETITLDMLSEHFFISKHHLNKVFKKYVGRTVVDYLIHMRIQYAQILIRNGESVQNASLEVGFPTYSSFYRSYMNIMGHSPSEDKIPLKDETAASVDFKQGIIIK